MKREGISTEGPFAREHAYVLEHFVRDLPPVSLHVKLITVIPAYKELENHNVWRLLHAMSTQAGVQPDEHEVLYVVNNNSSAVLTDRDAYKDNKKTLQLLNTLTEAREAYHHGAFDEVCARKTLQNLIPGPWEWEVFMRCVRKDISILGIDASSILRARAQSKFGPNPRGVARNVGGHIAYERLAHAEIGDTGGIDFLDGDCLPSHTYVAHIITALHTSDAQFFSKSLFAIPGSIAFEGASSPAEKILFNISYLKDILTRRSMYASNPQAYVHGPAPVVRARTFKAVAGYSMQGRVNEDFKFGSRLTDLTHIDPEAHEAIPGATVYIQDRLRASSVDGNIDRMGLHRGTPDPRGLSFLRPHATSAELQTMKQLLFADLVATRRSDYVAARQKAFEQESLRRKVFIAGMRDIVARIVNRVSPVHVEKNSRAESKAHPNRALFEEVIEGMTVLSDNATLLEQCGVDPQLPKEQRVWALLETLLPEFFAPPPKKEPDYEALRNMNDRRRCNVRDLIHLSTIR